ncbi:MAG: thioredoxin domain-containing protein [Alphaproteobacteria bacterium]|nr:thioredoxin domain-containing protein [Alphaproteobacteria bacterium]
MGFRTLFALVAAIAAMLFLNPGHAADALSPYWQSHAADPVHWQPWNEDTLAGARRDQRMVFLSIGYASCHWCHEMERETFRDPAVAQVLNQNYVNILIDREERPDLDAWFSAMLVAMNGHGGWPANLLLTPDLVPLFGANFLAPAPRYGDPGFLDVITALADTWTRDRPSILKNVETVRGQLQALSRPPDDRSGPRAVAGDPRDRAVAAWRRRFDPEYGGFDNEPKFPQPVALSALLRRGSQRHDQALLAEVYRTLDAMAASGVRDPLSGAFFRYAVDRAWRIPHFEIMLADNAILASLYLEAFQASGQPRYAAVARAILGDLESRFRLADGAFATALDADSATEGGVRGEEGAFYTWTADEITAALGPAAAPPVIAAFLDPHHGTLRGRSILRHLDPPDRLMETETRLAASLSQLRTARASREPPPRDDTVLTSGNALAVSAFARAARVFGDGHYLEVATAAMDRLLAAESLRHARRGDTVSKEVFLDDYACLVQALLDLFETDFAVSHLDRARELALVMVKRFQTGPGHPFSLTPADATESAIPVQTVLDEEGLPSGNAVALAALRRLALFGADADGFGQRVEAILGGLDAAVAPGLLIAIDFSPEAAREVVIVGHPGDAATRALLDVVNRRLLPGTVLAVIGPTDDDGKWALLTSRPLIDGKPAAYVCHDRRCDRPVTTATALALQLDSPAP